MATKVLVFESDSAFADQLKSGLARYGCQTSVVDDATVGLQVAHGNKPDLILLSIELPRMNGFSVCNKLKRDAALKDVPLIIMSSDSTEETFEQHRRLRTRAEDYVHKPIRFEELVSRIQEFVKLPQAGTADEEPIDADEIEIDDAEPLEELENIAPQSAEPESFGGDAVRAEIVDDTQAKPVALPRVGDGAKAGIDQDVNEFAEQAFGALIETRPAQKPISEPEVKAVEDDEPASGTARSGLTPVGKAKPAAVSPTAPTDQKHQVAMRLLQQELAAAKKTISELQSAASKPARDNPEVQRLQKELDEAKSRLVSGKTSSSTAREFLDLREQLNRKDKEILEIRDTLTHKEKELLSFRDNNLSLERERADFQDRIGDLEKQVSDLNKAAEAHRNDREQAVKRADDFKRKWEKQRTDLEARSQELAELKAQQQKAAAEQQEREATLRSEHERALEQARAALQEQLASVKAESERRVGERESELTQEFEAKISALHRANQDALNKLKAEQGQALSEAEQAAATRLSAREAELQSQHSGEAARMTQSHEAALDAFRTEKQQAEAARDDKIGALEQSVRSAQQTIEENRAAMSSLETKLASQAQELEQTRKTVEETGASADALQKQLDERTGERDGLRETVEEHATTILSLKGELNTLRDEVARKTSELERELEGVREQLRDEQRKMQAARDKWGEDRAALERAKDALAAALAQIEDTENRELQ
ncbi:MAG TPA: response regulator [Polyangiaceae bacterium]|jgi:CheY-like chemotaxis protein